MLRWVRRGVEHKHCAFVGFLTEPLNQSDLNAISYIWACLLFIYCIKANLKWLWAAYNAITDKSNRVKDAATALQSIRKHFQPFYIETKFKEIVVKMLWNVEKCCDGGGLQQISKGPIIQINTLLLIQVIWILIYWKKLTYNGIIKGILHFFLEIGSFYNSPRVKQLSFTLSEKKVQKLSLGRYIKVPICTL